MEPETVETIVELSSGAGAPAVAAFLAVRLAFRQIMQRLAHLEAHVEAIEADVRRVHKKQARNGERLARAEASLSRG